MLNRVKSHLQTMQVIRSDIVTYEIKNESCRVKIKIRMEDVSEEVPARTNQ